MTETTITFEPGYRRAIEIRQAHRIVGKIRIGNKVAKAPFTLLSGGGLTISRHETMEEAKDAARTHWAN